MILHLAIQIYIILPHFNILPYVYLYFLTIFNIQFTQKFIKHDSHFAQKKNRLASGRTRNEPTCLQNGRGVTPAIYLYLLQNETLQGMMRNTFFHPPDIPL